MLEDIGMYIAFVLCFAIYFVMLYSCYIVVWCVCWHFYNEYKRMRYKQMGKNLYV